MTAPCDEEDRCIWCKTGRSSRPLIQVPGSDTHFVCEDARACNETARGGLPDDR